MKVHFIGIGGIGVSALAKYFLRNGWEVSGSDAVSSDTTDELQKNGVKIFIGHRANQVTGAKLIVYSSAVPVSNPEILRAKKSRIQTISYAEAIGSLTKNFYTIAVAGSHGKSTTTALLSLILIRAGFDPVVIIGTKLKEFPDKNFRNGKKYLVLEADEWNKSFHSYFPKVIVLTNIDKEHLDTYKTYRGVVNGFARFIGNLSPDGFLVANFQDKAIRAIAKKSPAQVVWYNRGKFAKHPLRVAGAHNQLNAEAAWQTAKKLGIKKSVADYVFKRFRGSWRRLEKLKENIFTDYAHHPTEIKATLSALREKYPKKKIVCVFQPHQQDRLSRLFNDFAAAFDDADKIIFLPVYAVRGREKNGGKSSVDLMKAVSAKSKTPVFYAEDFKEALSFLADEIKQKQAIVFMSAGDLDSNIRKALL